MIITQTRQSRSFIGSMNPGTDVIDGMARICVDNAIFCAQFSGIGYLKNPALKTYNIQRKGYDPTVHHDGTFHVVALHGNVSLQERRTVIEGHVVGTLRVADGDPVLLSGELVAGEIVKLEISLTTNDDIRLYRAEDDRTGLEPWLHMDLGEGPPPATDDGERLQLLPSAPGASHTEADDADVEVGDWLDHPTLGTARVAATDDEDHVTIELGSGRKVQLHLNLLELSPKGEHDAGGRIFGVSIRRRR